MPADFSEKIVKIKRVTKVVKGGRRFSFTALVVIGNKKGVIGVGLGKANEVPDAIKKAIEAAYKNRQNASIINGTIPHDIIGKNGAGKVLLKPAYQGTGVKAGGAVRSVLELAGITDILSKSLGTRNSHNLVLATLNALLTLRTKEQIAALRDKEVSEIYS